MITREITPHDELTVLKLLSRNGNTLGFVSLSTSLPTDAVRVIGEQYGWPDREQIKRAIPRVQREIDAEERDRLMGAPVLHETPRLITARPAPATVQPPAPVAPKPASDPVEKHELPAGAEEPGQTEWERIVELASQSHRAATRALGAKLLTTYQQVRDALKDEADYRVQQEREARERRKVEEEIAELEAQLAAARAKLKPAKAVKPKIGRGKAPGSAAVVNDRRDYQREVLARHSATVADVRTWARDNGHTVADRGAMLARTVLDAYDQAHR